MSAGGVAIAGERPDARGIDDRAGLAVRRLRARRHVERDVVGAEHGHDSVIRAERRRATVRQISIAIGVADAGGGELARAARCRTGPSVHVMTSVIVSRIFVARISTSAASVISPDMSRTLPSGTPVSARASSASASARSATMPLLHEDHPELLVAAVGARPHITPSSSTTLRVTPRRSNVIGADSLRFAAHSSTSSADIVLSAPRTDIL